MAKPITIVIPLVAGGAVDTLAGIAARVQAELLIDRDKAALAGIEPEQVAATLRLAVDGLPAAVVHGHLRARAGHP